MAEPEDARDDEAERRCQHALMHNAGNGFLEPYSLSSVIIEKHTVDEVRGADAGQS